MKGQRGFAQAVIPEAVWQEITRAPSFADAASLQVAADARGAGWLQVATAANRPLVMQLETALDPGEAEAIALAVERAPSLLPIDERDSRQVARTLGVPHTRSLGVLLRAKALGHTPAIKPPLKELLEQHHFRRRQFSRLPRILTFPVVHQDSIGANGSLSLPGGEPAGNSALEIVTRTRGPSSPRPERRNRPLLQAIQAVVTR